ncbi:hypothetical protein [uncultured Bilophila sp.]|uniref:hypothetical protein n=1 Tax=uncultured Bilophila sp. TaxID=529385 RepID=UPI00280C24F7|nr:hypothetical protein [uncultured Bilophila sp.]
MVVSSPQHGENQPFSPVFPLAESTAQAFSWLFLWNFKERVCHGMWLFHLHSTLKIRLFYPFFPLTESTAKTFCWLSLWNFKREKYQPSSMAQPEEKASAIFSGTT